MPQVKQSRYAILLILLGVIIVLGSQNALAVEVNYTISNGRFNGMELANSLADWMYINFSMTPKFGDSIFFNSSAGAAGDGYYLWNSSSRFAVKEGHNKTWEGWAYLNKDLGGGGYIFQLCTSGVGSLAYAWLNLVSGGNNITLSSSTVSANNLSFMQTHPYQPNIASKGWFHWAIEYYNSSYTGSTKTYIKAYFNGTRFNFINNTKIVAELANAITFGGACSTTSGRWNGGFDEVRVSNMTRYNNTFTVPSAAFINDSRTIALYHFNMANFTINRPFFNKTVILNVSSNNRFNIYIRNAIIGKLVLKPRFNSTKWNYTLYWNGAGSFFNFSSFINNLPVGTYDAMAVYGGIGSRWNRTSLTGFSYEVTLPTKVQLCNASSVGNTFVAYNFSFFDEVNRTKFKNVTKFEAYFSVNDVNNASGFKRLNLSITNPKYVGICLQPKHHLFKINSTIKYQKNGFNFRNYYLYQDKVNLTVGYRFKNTSLYLLQDSIATLITISTLDSLASPLTDIITEIQRFYIANNTFVTIGMIKSGEDGKDVVYLQQNSPQYRFLVYQYGILVKTTTGQVISSASYSITIIPTSLSDLITNARNLITNITFNNHTKSFHYGFYDPSSKIFGACLQVSLSNGTGKYYKPLNCTYGSYRNLLKLSPGNRTGSVYDGFGYVIFNGSTLYHGQRPLQFLDGLYFNAKTWGKYGLYLLIILLTMLVMIPIASGSPTAALVIMMVGLFSAWWMDIFSVSTLVFTSLMIGLGIVIKELRSG